jgi:cell wall-associated NlpC family hydrolase
MKQRLLTITILGLQTGICMSAKAQQAKAPRFIENIEVIPKVYQGSVITTSTEIKPVVEVQSSPSAALITATPDDIEKCSKIQFKYALMMNREVESMDNSVLYSFIDDWINTPYHFGGCTKDGIDCSSFTSTLQQQVYGIDIPRSAKEQYSKCTKIERADLKEGDLVFFHTFKGVSHVGVYLGNNYFVHSSTHSGVTIDNLDEAYYNKRYIGGGRISK